MNVKERCLRLDLNPDDDDDKVEEFLQDVGGSHSMVSFRDQAYGSHVKQYPT